MGKFKTGEVNNPFGNLPIGQDLKDARKLTKLEFERLSNKYLHMTLEEIERAAQSKSIPAIEACIVSILYRALKEGDDKRLNFFLDRTIGQAVKRIKVETEQDDGPRRLPVTMSPEEKLEMLEKMKQRIRDAQGEQERDVINVEPIKS